MVSPAPFINRPHCAEFELVPSSLDVERYSPYSENQGYHVTQRSLSYENISPLHIEYMLWDSVRHATRVPRRQSRCCSYSNSLWYFRMRRPATRCTNKQKTQCVQITQELYTNIHPTQEGVSDTATMQPEQNKPCKMQEATQMLHHWQRLGTSP